MNVYCTLSGEQEKVAKWRKGSLHENSPFYFFEVSAKTGLNCEKVLDTIAHAHIKYLFPSYELPPLNPAEIRRMEYEAIIHIL